MFSTVKKRLDGFKTIIGGVGLIITGIIILFVYFFPEFKNEEINKAIELFSAGFTALGLGGKLQKMLEK